MSSSSSSLCSSSSASIGTLAFPSLTVFAAAAPPHECVENPSKGLSSEYALELSQILKDDELLGKLLDILENYPPSQALVHFFNHPFLQARLKPLSGQLPFDLSAIGSQLKLLVPFISKNLSRLRDPLIQGFIAGQLNKLQTCLTILSLCGEKTTFELKEERLRFLSRKKVPEHILDPKYAWQMQQLVASPALPPIIREPLKALFQKAIVPSSHQISSQILRGEKGHPQLLGPRMMRQEVIELAVKVALEIDGSDMNGGGIRLWVHQCPRGQEERPAILLNKIMQEFASGRRYFRFEPQRGQVPASNYKQVMRYVVEGLKRDRENYYKDHPLDPHEYEAVANELDRRNREDAFFSSDLEKSYVFEWVARRLIAMEAEIEGAASDPQIEACLKKFQNIYCNLPNFNMDLTVVSCLSRNVFSLGSQVKPMLYYGVPPDLKVLADQFRVESDSSIDPLLGALNGLPRVLYRIRGVAEKIERLQAIYQALLNDPNNSQLMRQFIDQFESIPNRTEWLGEMRYKHPEQHKDPEDHLYSLITRLKHLTEMSKEYFERQVQALEKSAKKPKTEADRAFCEILKKHQALLHLAAFDSLAARHTFEIILSEIEQLHAEDWIADMAAQFRKILKLDMQEYPLNFKYLQERANETLVSPREGVGAYIASFQTAFTRQYKSPTDRFHAIYAAVSALKHFIVGEMLHNPEFSGESAATVHYALGFLEAMQIAISREVLNTPQSQEEKGLSSISPETLQFATRIARDLGVLEREATTLPALKKELSLARQNSAPDYRALLRQIINSPHVLEMLSNKGFSPESAIQMLQANQNTGIRYLLDQCLGQKKEEGLPGMATMDTDVIGRVRIAEEGIPAKKGEILLIEHAAPEVHLYKEAAAIISRQGGIFSHAAITFSELGIPALLGCDIDLLKPLNGQVVRLHLSDTPQVERVDPALLERSEQDQKPALIAQLQKRLYSTDHPLEKIYLFSQLEKLLDKADQRYVELQRRALELVPHRHAFVSKGGKKENLDYLTAVIPSLSSPLLKLAVPPYQSYTADELVWRRNPALKQQVLTILHSGLANPEKSQQITRLIAGIPLGDLALYGDNIVRSSAKLEDQAKTAAAGIFESVRVQGKSSDAFRQVLASAFSEKALAFFGANDALLDMTWIVQKYVSGAQYSGVAFSVADEKDWNVAGMQIVPGLGGGVDGKQTPAVVSFDTRDMTLTDLRLERGKKLPCDISIAKEIALLTKKLEADYKCPIEIEFAVDGDTLNIFQIRPITKYM